MLSWGDVDTCVAAKALRGARLQDLPGAALGWGLLAKYGQPCSFLLQGPRGLLGPKGPPGPPGPPVRPVTSARLSTRTLAQG